MNYTSGRAGKTRLLQALFAGFRLEGKQHTQYPGEQVEYAPRVDQVNGHPDFYA